LSRDAEGHEIKTKHYYVMESVGIAAGILLSALHIAGLATLTHTPSPMGFSEQDHEPAEKREALSIDSGRLSSRGSHGASNHKEALA
jgi:hypothetical protein